MFIWSRNGDRKIIQPFRITSGRTTKRSDGNKFSQFRGKSIKLIPTEKTSTGCI